MQPVVPREAAARQTASPDVIASPAAEAAAARPGIEDATDPRRLALPARLDPAAAEELAEALEHLRGLPLVLDGAAVEQPGGLFLQLLAIARRQWQADAQPFRLVDASPALADALELLDLTRLFQPEEALECR
jgi:anti-anti-sigma regulatory factor